MLALSQLVKTLTLALDGYEYEPVEALVQKLLGSMAVEELVPALTTLVEKYLVVEDNFAGIVLDDAMINLVKVSLLNMQYDGNDQPHMIV